ncbi:oligosaccharide flippase family protein [Methylophaga sp.]|uniref:oligosaccharide flippase family protein n=1 Tax=Methylophaga sp. TaxID=2024840 RepID=UPI003A955BC6
MKFITKNFKGENLRARILRSSSITFASYGLQQILRLISNLILTRILFPEAFGIMALATAILVGLTMLSDIGIEQSVIQNKSGSKGYFRNTAWVAQIFRGVILWAFACLIAYPIALTYESPILFPLICALGSTLAIKGFSTTSLAVANKELKIFKLSIVTLGIQVSSVVLTIIFAFYTNSVWALVWGNVISSLIGVFAGHIFLNDGFKHRFVVDWLSMRQIISFGKWIFISSIFGFLANQADKMIIGKVLSLTELGIYTIALTLAEVPRSILFSLNRKVLFPVYSKIQDESEKEIRKKVLRSKLLICGMLLPIALFLLIFGSHITELLYDERYINAGWMLQVLAAGVAFQIATNVGPFYLGFGRSGLFAFTIGIKAALLISSMLIGSALYGSAGLVAGITISSVLYYFVEIFYLYKFRIWFWYIDLFLIILIGLVSFWVYKSNI